MEMEKKIVRGETCISTRDIHRYLGIGSQYSDWVRRRGFLNDYPKEVKDELQAWLPVPDAVGAMVSEAGPVAEKVREKLIDGMSPCEIIDEISEWETA